MKNLLSIRFLILIIHLMLLVNHIRDKVSLDDRVLRIVHLNCSPFQAGDTRVCFVKSQLTSDFEPSPTQ